MHFSNQILSLCLIFKIMASVESEHNLNANQLTGDDFEKRRSVKEFFDTLVAGSNQNTKTSSHSPSPSTPRPSGPIYMPFAVPVHSPPPPPPGPHVHIAPPPTFGYPSNINNIYRVPPPPPPSHSRPHIHITPLGQGYGPPHHHIHHNLNSEHNHHNHHNFGPLSSMQQNLESQSHHFPIPHPSNPMFNHFEYGQHSRPIAIAIPLPLHAIPLHLIPHNHNEDNHKPNNFLPNHDFNDGMSPTSKFALFADPYEDIAEEDLYDNSQQRYKFVPLPKQD